MTILLLCSLTIWSWGWSGWIRSKHCNISTSMLNCWYKPPGKSWWRTRFVCYYKTKKSLLDFLILFVTILYFSRCDKAKISVSLYHMKTMCSRWCPGCVCLSSFRTNVVVTYQPQNSSDLSSYQTLSDISDLLSDVTEFLTCIIRSSSHIH